MPCTQRYGSLSAGPYPVNRIMNFTVPLNVTAAFVCSQGLTTTLNVELALTGRAGNGPYLSQKTSIVAA
jgi:hypothetical protein